jgi:hypothetical protein
MSYPPPQAGKPLPAVLWPNRDGEADIVGKNDGPVPRLRAFCLALPQTTERASHGEPCFFVQATPKSSKLFVMLDEHHHGAEHLAFWCAAAAGAQEEMIAEDPSRYFRPPYVGHRGWLGVRLQAAGLPEPDWREIGEIVRDAYRQVAPPALRAALDG